MLKKLIYLVCIILPIFQGCKATKFAPEDQNVEKIIFGHGGGYAGLKFQFHAFPNGQIFAVDLDNNFKELAQVDKKTIKKVFKNCRNLDWDNVSINETGNLYKFLIHITPENKETALWHAGIKPDQSILDLYLSLNAFTKAKKE